MKIYLVTGVAGFIGSAVAKKLLSNGDKVIGIDNLSTGHIEQVPSGVEFFEIGIHEIEVLKILNNFTFDAIFHIAGQSGGELSYADPVYDLQANAQSTLLLLKTGFSLFGNKKMSRDAKKTKQVQHRDPRKSSQIFIKSLFFH